MSTGRYIKQHRRRHLQLRTNSSDFRIIYTSASSARRDIDVDDTNITDDVRWFAQSRRTLAAVPLRLSAAAGRRSYNRDGGLSRFRGGGGGGGAKEKAAKAAEAWRGSRGDGSGGAAGKVLLETVRGTCDGFRCARQTRRRPSVSENCCGRWIILFV